MKHSKPRMKLKTPRRVATPIEPINPSVWDFIPNAFLMTNGAAIPVIMGHVYKHGLPTDEFHAWTREAWNDRRRHVYEVRRVAGEHRVFLNGNALEHMTVRYGHLSRYTSHYRGGCFVQRAVFPL